MRDHENGAGLARIALLVAAGLGVGWLGREWWAHRHTADLRGEVVLVTGGSRGLGLLLAEEFGRLGCRVAICARDPQELEVARVRLFELGVEVLATVCDVGEQAAVETMVAAVEERFGKVDILVNNAVVLQVGPFLNMTVEDFEQAHRVAFWGALYCTLAVLPGMRARRYGRLVNITSIGGRVSVPHMLPYSTAKFAATALSEGLRAELSGEGITVTTILPGELQTGAHLHTRFRGHQRDEYNWFATGESLPLGSIDARRAAREIVDATRRGEAERVLSASAVVLALLHGLLPGQTADLLGLVHRTLLPPVAPEGSDAASGLEVREREPRPVRDTVLAPGDADARRTNGLSGQEAAGL